MTSPPVGALGISDFYVTFVSFIILSISGAQKANLCSTSDSLCNVLWSFPIEQVRRRNLRCATRNRRLNLKLKKRQKFLVLKQIQRPKKPQQI